MPAINIAEAKSRFSELISRASAGERFIIQRRDHPLAVLISTDELARLERTAHLAHRLASALGQDAHLLGQVEAGEIHAAMLAFGLWQDEPNLETLTSDIYTNRKQQQERPDLNL
jgi:prevent-host-death family protein